VKPEKILEQESLVPTTSLDNRAYILQELDGKAILRTWNATHLKFYFS